MLSIDRRRPPIGEGTVGRKVLKPNYGPAVGQYNITATICVDCALVQ